MQPDLRHQRRRRERGLGADEVGGIAHRREPAPATMPASSIQPIQRLALELGEAVGGVVEIDGADLPGEMQRHAARAPS